MPTLLSFDPQTWDSPVEAPFTLGSVIELDGKRYQYVQLVNDASATDSPGNGTVVEQASTTSYLVTTDRVGGSSLGRAPVGVLVGTVTRGNYCFMQVGGVHPAVKDAANSLAANGKVTSHPTTDGDAAAATAYADIVVGVALAAASGGIVSVMLELG